ncbi:MAG: tetratricopeptide repeat protein [Anaerolineaceae bacterium]|nr:tetratricopeptide repeat protein [Anaerolineaceae bacterium]
MIDIGSALQWVNWEYPSVISDSLRYWIGRIMDPILPPDERLATMSDLIKVAGGISNPLEQAEILIYCGGQGYVLGDMDNAANWLIKAADLYEYCQDHHRHATALWMLFIVQRSRGKYRQAFDMARRARKLFIDQADDRLQKKETATESWYRGRILDMTCELISSPEDMFECLFEFQGSNLSSSAAEIKNRIAIQVEKKDYQKTGAEMELLLGITIRSLCPQETAEALAFCGVVSWVLEDKKGAINFFRSAMSQYIPKSFEYAVLQWMLGLGLFTVPAEVYSAVNQMETSIQNFDQLRMKAIHENHLERRDWFATHHSAMKRVLRTMVEAT